MNAHLAGSCIGRKPYVWMPRREKKRPSVTAGEQHRDRPRGSGRARAASRRACRTGRGRARPATGSWRTISNSGSTPASARSSANRSSGPKPGSRRPSSSSETALGDHVDLLAAADDRGARGVVQQRVEQRRALAERVEQPVGQRRRQQPAQRQRERRGQLVGDRLDHRARDGRDVDGQAAAVERASRRPSLPIAPPRDRHRAVAGLPAQRRARPAELLLGDHDRVEAPAGDVDA